MTTIGSRVRAARKELGLTMKALHDKTGLSTGNISDIENDKNTPSASSLSALSRALGCSVEWLLSGEEATARKPEQSVSISRSESRGVSCSESRPHSLSCDGVELSPMERDLIAMFRLLPRGARKEVFDLVHFKYSRLADGEKESIFWTYFDESNDEQSGPAESRETRDGTA